MKIKFLMFIIISMLTINIANAADADRRVVVINNTKYTIVSIQASSVMSDNWEENIIRGGKLKPGERVRLNLDDGSEGCMMDFRATTANGKKVWESQAQNTCVLETWTLNN